jgi:hypothetical protein
VSFFYKEETMSDDKPPFDQSYVMRVTVAKINKAIDTSFYKTSSRLEEFEEKSPKWIEVLNTLHSLHALRKVFEEFEIANKSLFINDNKPSNEE